jgi:hypothetical protein
MDELVAAAKSAGLPPGTTSVPAESYDLMSQQGEARFAETLKSASRFRFRYRGRS